MSGPLPILALACSATPDLELPSTHSGGYGSRSSPAFRRSCPAPTSRIPVQFAGSAVV